MPGERLNFTNLTRFLAFIGYLAKGVPNLLNLEKTEVFLIYISGRDFNV
jgi:hypothetical protein